MSTNQIIIMGIFCLLTLSFTAGGEKETVSVVDACGESVDVPLNPERIIVLPSTPIELIYALGEGDRIVGRGVSVPAYCPSAEDLPCIASCGVGPNVEAILDLNPDLVIMCPSSGISVLKLPSSCEPETLLPQIETLGLILDKEERTDEFVGFIEEYLDLIEERTKDLKQEERPTVYFECKEDKTVNGETPLQHHIDLAGGTNIAAEQSVERPVVSPEWVLEMNPDIVVVSVSGSSPHTEEAMRGMVEETLSRPGLKEVKAVEEEQVYAISKKLMKGIGMPIGCLYFAKWFHPDLFEDVDPGAMHEELLQRFFYQELEGVYAYP
jgi:iron complex transport system substrate-binding protein